MKLLILSDSHNNTSNMKLVFDLVIDKVNAILFLGDMVDDIVRYEHIYGGVDFYYVSGNCDFNYIKPQERIVELGGKKIFMAHGHTYGVKYNTGEIKYSSKLQGADICLFGHTHRPTCYEEKGLWVMNPGSITYPRGYPHPSYGIIDIEGEEVKGSIVDLVMGRPTPSTKVKEH